MMNLLLLCILVMVGVRCDDENVTLRLYGGNETAGIVLLYQDGSWGTICDDLWGDDDARVACRQVGLSGGKAVMDGPFYFNIILHRDIELKSMPLLLNHVDCSGSEDALYTCESSREIDLCDQTEAAGVVCQPAVTMEVPMQPIPTEINHVVKWRSTIPDSQNGVGVPVASDIIHPTSHQDSLEPGKGQTVDQSSGCGNCHQANSSLLIVLAGMLFSWRYT